MAENLTPIKLDEMRPGLFRIHWTSFMEIQKNLSIYTEEFQLSGSQAGCKFKITYHLKSFPSPENNSNNCDYTVTIDEIPCNDDSCGPVSNVVNLGS